MKIIFSLLAGTLCLLIVGCANRTQDDTQASLDSQNSKVGSIEWCNKHYRSVAMDSEARKRNARYCDPLVKRDYDPNKERQVDDQ